MDADPFQREIDSFIGKARRDFARARDGILSAQANKGALKSGATAKMIVRAAIAATLDLGETLSVEAAASARPGPTLERRRDQVVRAMGGFTDGLWDMCDFSPLGLDSPAAEAALQGMLDDGREDVRRSLQRYRDGRAAGPPQPWIVRHPSASFWINAGLSAAAVALALLAYWFPRVP
jgi:hypothetical protein